MYVIFQLDMLIFLLSYCTGCASYGSVVWSQGQGVGQFLSAFVQFYQLQCFIYSCSVHTICSQLCIFYFSRHMTKSSLCIINKSKQYQYRKQTLFVQVLRYLCLSLSDGRSKYRCCFAILNNNLSQTVLCDQIDTCAYYMHALQLEVICMHFFSRMSMYACIGQSGQNYRTRLDVKNTSHMLLGFQYRKLASCILLKFVLDSSFLLFFLHLLLLSYFVVVYSFLNCLYFCLKLLYRFFFSHVDDNTCSLPQRIRVANLQSVIEFNKSMTQVKQKLSLCEAFLVIFQLQIDRRLCVGVYVCEVVIILDQNYSIRRKEMQGRYQCDVIQRFILYKDQIRGFMIVQMVKITVDSVGVVIVQNLDGLR
eukprot:TRINITY_DN24791_c1_g1_i2.p1 TRINITY_DN24791_c1_g1~~TRINITY_DN24791_c1_g1_i2.p1  ORF type:complete len:364 (-),score=-10.42 TRINITY_DN24791_c1_g1_i2:80-1171(-)